MKRVVGTHRSRAAAPAGAVAPEAKVAPDAVGEVARPAVSETADPAVREPVVPATEPLPSDQISSPQELTPAVVAPAIDPEAPLAPAPAETAPLPAPGPAPAASAEAVTAKAPLREVDATIPLPSDQLTPVVRDAPEYGAAGGRVSFAGLADLPAKSLRLTVTGAPAAMLDELRERFEDEGIDIVLVAGEDEEAASAVQNQAEPNRPDRDALDLLRRDLDAAGFGAVILQADTVDLLRREFDLPPIAGERGLAAAAPDNSERRVFRVLYDVEHDGQPVRPGGPVTVTRAQFDRLLRGQAIPSGTEWLDGEELL